MLWDVAVADWRRLPSDPGAVFDKEIRVDITTLEPQVTWGTTQQHVAGVGQPIPDPANQPDAVQRDSMERALRYQGLVPGRPIEGTPINVAFIGSCTNSRLSDLVVAADVARGRRVAPGVRALVVPGSMQVMRDAEALGLREVFLAAGFEWREPGCSMCIAINDDGVAAGERCISTSNRNFEDRQGPRARTHLASPATVAASAIEGGIADARKLHHH
jgi:3-isopropylmalate/(R)-2-methylmalate dehydratase large subunit